MADVMTHENTDSRAGDSSTGGSLPFPIVGIGASAGGLSAVCRLLEQLPATPGMAFVVILHLSPRHESRADAVLQAATRMPVLQVTKPIALKPDHVYVISPRLDLEMADGYLRVTRARRPHGRQVAIDLFLRTLADVHRGRAIGIVLSGTASDGTLGIARVKEQGGVTIAQSPADSEYEDMPRNAIATGKIDFVLPVSEMGQLLLDLWQNAKDIALPVAENRPVAATVPDTSPDAEAALRDILELLHSRTGHDFRYYKRATVLRRIERRLQVNMLKDLPSYRDYLDRTPAETPALLNDMLISVTNFFRDRESFEAVERDVIPVLLANRSRDEPTRVWVPGCATGEEAYSLAMLLSDAFKEAGQAPAFQVFASDIDAPAIATARAGNYPASIIADIPPARLRSYLAKEHDHYRIRKSLRERVLFAVHNVLRDPPFSHVDMISCRNLMIYLDRSIQTRLLQTFHFALRPGGVLFLGSSESVDAASPQFELVDKKHRIYRARNAVRSLRQAAPLPRKQPAPSVSVPMPASTGATARAFTFAEVHQRVLEFYAPPSVVVDRESRIVHMSENAGRFLRHPGGEPSFDLLAMVRPELRVELRTALFQALQTGKSIEAARVRMDLDGQMMFVNMIARPFHDPDAGSEFVLVLFDEVEDTLASAVGGTGDQDEDNGDGGGSHREVIRTLEMELQATKERLQVTVEQSDTSTEELRASNEELQAINEELRSATEELETSKEELQSVNEELITVNAELKGGIEETARVNDDLQNFIVSTEIATVFVDPELRVKRYTPQAEGIFNIIASDVGRCLLDITHRLEYPQLAEDAARAFDTLRPVEREVRSNDGRRYVVRALPYRTIENRIEGATLSFIDISGLRRAEEQALLSSDQLRLAAAATSDHAIVVIDAAGTVTAWNAGAETLFGYAPDEMLGKSLEAIFLPEDIVAGVLATEMAAASRSGSTDEDRWHQRKDGTRIFCTGTLTAFNSDTFQGFAKIVRDGTVKHRAEMLGAEDLRSAVSRREEVESSSAMKDDFLAVMSHELKNPLNLISVGTEILARVPEVRGSEVSRQALSSIRRAVRGQTKIIDDLLDMSRIRTGKFSLNLAPVDLNGMVENIAEAARPDTSGAGLELVVNCGAEPAVVRADPTRLEQIVWNLLSNAIKFTPEGGRITLDVVAEPRQVRLVVRDDGQGIEPAYLPRIFDMFGQAPGRALRGRGGLGIGLSLVSQLAARQGGKVHAASDGPGRGSTFTVTLPRFQQPAMHAAESHASGAPRLQGWSILVVEDAVEAAAALCSLLELEGASTVVAHSGAEALRQLERHRVDVVLSDVGMPEMDGYALIEALRKEPRHAGLKVIALTGFGRKADISRAAKAGFDAHLSKPVDVEQLIESISMLMPDADTSG